MAQVADGAGEGRDSSWGCPSTVDLQVHSSSYWLIDRYKLWKISKFPVTKLGSGMGWDGPSGVGGEGEISSVGSALALAAHVRSR